MRVFTVLLLLVVALPAYAADKVLILNPQDQQDLINALDASVRSGGLNSAVAAMRIVTKLQTAGTVTDQKEVKPEDKPVPKEGPPQ